MALGDVIARLSVSLGLETAAFERGSKKAAKEVSGLERSMSRLGKIGGAIGAAFLASGIGDLARSWADATKAALEFAGGLGEAAQQIGVTTDELQEYRYVASQTGIEQAAMDKALQKTTRTLGELATPTKAQAEALQQLGLSAKDLQGLGTGDFIALLADKFQGLSATTQAALGAQLGLGRGFQTLIPLLNEGAAGIAKMRDEAHKLGIVISEEAIKNADVNADLLTTYEKIAEAQKTAALTVPDNVRAYMAYNKAVTDLQIGFYKLVGGISKWADEHKHWETDVVPAWRAFEAWSVRFQKSISDMVLFVPRAIGNMVNAISQWMAGTLQDVWNGALAKIETVKRAFFNLYDAVVGHSYIPDMVDGIAAHMARLDAVMVNPATKATKATTKEFQALRDTLDRLFPEVGRTQGFNADLARIQGSALNDNEKDEAVRRLWREFTSGSPFGSGGMGGPDFGGVGPLVDGLGKTEEAIQRLTDKSKINTVRIAKSFKDMADETLQSLGRLTNAIKGGGFLGILEAVIGFGLQLGSMGVFGKSIAANINRVPGHANGTMSAGRGLALVGERGPELVAFRGGERVYSNRESRGMMGGNTYHIEGNLLTPEFWGMIQAGDVAAAQAGARGGVALGQYRQSRRWR